jgi:hypothetical protein
MHCCLKGNVTRVWTVKLKMIQNGLLLVILICAISAYARAPELPATIGTCMKSVDARLEIDRRLNPFYLRGDFDGDGRRDYAVLVRRGTSRGIAICLASSPKAMTLGAGSAFHGMTDMDFTSWNVYEKRFVERGVGEGSPPRLIGEAIRVEWEESASALIYWRNRKFLWYQQGD